MRMPTRNEVLAELRLILESERFARVKQGKKLLRYLVTETLKHPKRKPRIKGVVIGIEVYKKPDYDPKKQSTVKIGIRDLRKCLSEYYAGAGRDDRVIVKLPEGSYVPRFRLNPAVAALDLDSHALLKLSQARRSMDQRFLGGILFAETLLQDTAKTYPKHPRLLALQAMCHAVRATYDGTTSPRQQLKEAESLVREVRDQKGPEPWECTVTDAWIRAALYWDWEKADGLFERAIAANSEASTCHCWYAFFLASQLKLEEAEAVVQEAVSRSAYDRTITRADLALFQILRGKLREAEETLQFVRPFERKFERLGYFPTGCGQAALLSAARGDFEEAINILFEALLDFDTARLTYGLLALFHGLAGHQITAQAFLDVLRQHYDSGSAFPLALTALGAGREDEAVDWLIRAAIVDRDPLMILLGLLPPIGRVYQNPRFRVLVTQKMNLAFWKAKDPRHNRIG
jgi:tetratricopeptide (TPR) repeat protein